MIFDAFNHDNYDENGGNNGVALAEDGAVVSDETAAITSEDGAQVENETPVVEAEKLDGAPVAQAEPAAVVNDHSTEEVDKW